MYLCGMKTIKISDLQKNCYSIIQKMFESQQSVIVTKRGKTIAKITPAQSIHNGSWLGSMSSTGKIVGDIISPIADESDWQVLQE